VQDKEPKYGLVVLGFVNPKRMLTKGGIRPGDALVLTKPLGFGVTTTALKQEKAAPEDVSEVVGWMKRLNQAAAALAVGLRLRGGTDVTGFGLLGHASEMAGASGVGIRFFVENFPFVTCAQKYAEMGTFAGGLFDNLQHFGPIVQFAPEVPQETRMLLFDPQTSGGLLLAVPRRKLANFLKRAGEISQPAWVVGQAFKGAGLIVK
jgi:selenide,water dikinase